MYSEALFELAKDFHPVLSPACVAKSSRSGEGLRVCLDRGYPRLQLASSSQGGVSRNRSLISSPTGRLAARPNLAEPSLHELCRYTKFQDTPRTGRLGPTYLTHNAHDDSFS